MNRRQMLAVVGWVAILSLAIAEIAMIVATFDHPPAQWGVRGYEVAIALTFGSAGALIAYRRPANAVGWLALGLSLLVAIGGAATITLSQKLFVALTGNRSDLPIVLTTLVMVALFTPVKNYLQKIVDRHFAAEAAARGPVGAGRAGRGGAPPA